MSGNGNLNHRAARPSLPPGTFPNAGVKYCDTIYFNPLYWLMGYNDRSTTKPLTGSVFYVLLALAEEDRYGLGIVQEVERRTGGDVILGPGTLYNIIKKMLASGLIKEVDPPREAGSDDPRRRYYGITPRGRRAFEAEADRLSTLLNAARAAGAFRSRS